MANATVEKIKALGFRHGEKAAVGLVSVLFVLFLVMAFNKPSLELTADQIKQSADSANQNINRPQDEEQIRARLVEEGLKNPDYLTAVASTASSELDATRFALTAPWTQPEPGTGLIRDMPELIAPNVFARAGRGGALVYQLDEQGNRIPATDEELKNQNAMHMMYGMGGDGYGGGGGMGTGMSKARADRIEAEAKKERDRQAAILKRQFVGSREKAPVTETKNAVSAVPEKSKETTKGFRWVAVTGTLDNKKLRENYATALRSDYASVAPNFQRLDLSRQRLGDDGEWSDWEEVAFEENEKILLNLPEADEEMTRDDTRLDAIVDMLPFLRAGYWKGVHVYALTDEAKREIAEPTPAMMMGMDGGMMGDYGSEGMMDEGMMGDYGSEGMMDSGYGDEGYGMGMGMGMGGGVAADFPKTEAEQVMVRGLDFTVQPGTTYRYRARIVVYNPNKDNESVAAGVDNKSEDLFGPRSEPTDEVSVPADISAYAIEMAPAPRNSAAANVKFQVASWDPEDGITAVKTFDVGPGRILGGPAAIRVPILDDIVNPKETTRLKPNIDFNTRQLVVDSVGGMQGIPRTLPRPDERVLGNFYQIPAFALTLRPDGVMVVRDEAIDKHNDEMNEMAENYRRSLQDAEDLKKSANSMMSGGYEGY